MKHPNAEAEKIMEWMNDIIALYNEAREKEATVIDFEDEEQKRGNRMEPIKVIIVDDSDFVRDGIGICVFSKEQWR